MGKQLIGRFSLRVLKISDTRQVLNVFFILSSALACAVVVESVSVFLSDWDSGRSLRWFCQLLYQRIEFCAGSHQVENNIQSQTCKEKNIEGTRSGTSAPSWGIATCAVWWSHDRLLHAKLLGPQVPSRFPRPLAASPQLCRLQEPGTKHLWHRIASLICGFSHHVRVALHPLKRIDSFSHCRHR